MIDYYLLTKPGIILGNLITFTAGFVLASKGSFDLQLFISTLIGLGLIIASACVFNNCIDRQVDQKMQRTKKRPLAEGKIKMHHAILFALILSVAGNLTLLFTTNLLTVSLANLGFCVYVFLYSFLKFQTSYSTLIGSVAGAIPPVVGYCAVSNQLDLAAALLFSFMIFWQMPHFFAIGLWHLEDYARAEIPILPVSKGPLRTKIHMLSYTLLLLPTLVLFTVSGYTGYLFLTVSAGIGIVWLFLCAWGFRAQCDKLWGRRMFYLSLVMINAVCILLVFDNTSDFLKLKKSYYGTIKLKET